MSGFYSQVGVLNYKYVYFFLFMHVPMVQNIYYKALGFIKYAYA